MLRLEDIKPTRVYQEGLEQGLEQGKLEQKLAMVPLLAELGLSAEQISQRLNLNLERVTEVLRQP